MFLCIFGLVLALKAIKKKFNNVFYFGLAILLNATFFGLKFFLNLFDVQSYKYGLPEIPFVLSLLPGIVFVKKTFYAGKNRPIIVIISIIYSFLAITSITLGALEDSPSPDPFFRIWRYIIDDIIVYPLVFTWNIVNGIREYKKTSKKLHGFGTPRFIFFSIGHAFGIASGIMDFISGILNPEFYEFYVIFSVVCAASYGIFMYITWFPPAALNRQLQSRVTVLGGNIGKTGPTDAKTGTVSGQSAATITNMRVLEYFGDVLSKIIGKSHAACSGLILLAVESQLGEDTVNRLTIKDLETVIGGELKNRLEKLGIPNATDAIAALKQELTTNLSLLTMMMF